MPELAFGIRGAEPVTGMMTPAVALHLNLANRPAGELVHTIVLRCQVQLETPRRGYTPEEKSTLRDLFGEPERWGQTLRPLLWTNLTTTVPAFSGSTSLELILPCTFDFNVSATKYFHGVEEGSIPMTLLFSGTVFYQSPAGQLQAAPIPWNSEARFSLPVQVWKKAVDLHFPNAAWLCIRRDVFERLYEWKVRKGLPTLEDAIERMMGSAQRMGAG